MTFVEISEDYHALFTTAMTLREVDVSVYQGELNQYYTIRSKVHDGAIASIVRQRHSHRLRWRIGWISIGRRVGQLPVDA
ncbi:hypothetical protein [Mycobacterium uberis]|uniref:hypothetical protein n=1 Tax=Mycobacterium uberis TaxID=2162698 RepID=UPI001A9D225E|nr:hypothetical protein [Mycobacterium uberis]